MDFKIPCAIFCFNRPLELGQLLSSLARVNQQLLGEIYIFNDIALAGTVNFQSNQQVLAITRAYANANDNVHLTIRNQNFGLIRNLTTGIEFVTKKHGHVLVLEDDLILSPTALEFVDQYKDTVNPGRIMHISLWTPFRNPSPFISKVMWCWGWYTTRECWENFDMQADYINFTPSSLDYPFSKFFSRTYHQSSVNKLQSWAIHWYASIRKLNGKCLNPPQSLAFNTGFSRSSTHTKSYPLFVQSRLGVYEKCDYSSTFDDIKLKESLCVKLRLSFYYCMHSNAVFRLIKKLLFWSSNALKSNN